MTLIEVKPCRNGWTVFDSRSANLGIKMTLRSEISRNNKGKPGTDMTRKLTPPYSRRMVIV
jgi:hypothetical protein